MPNETLIGVPSFKELKDVRLFMTKLITRLDTVIGFRGGSSYVEESEIANLVSLNDLSGTQQSLVSQINEVLTSLQSDITALEELIAEEIAGLVFTNNPEQSAITDLSYTGLTAAVAYDQSQIQQLMNDVVNVSAKVDEILVALRASDIIET